MNRFCCDGLCNQGRDCPAYFRDTQPFVDTQPDVPKGSMLLGQVVITPNHLQALSRLFSHSPRGLYLMYRLIRRTRGPFSSLLALWRYRRAPLEF
jgi:hypothetical protein